MLLIRGIFVFLSVLWRFIINSDALAVSAPLVYIRA